MFAHINVKAMLFYRSVDPTKTNKSHLFFHQLYRPPKKMNIEPKNDGLEDGISWFQGAPVFSGSSR